MSSVVFSPLYHYQYSFSYLYFEVILYAAHHLSLIHISEQVVGGWLLRPEVWQNEPMIYIKSAELRHLLRLPSSYARLTDLFDGKTYRLQQFWKGPKEKAVANDNKNFFM